MTGMGIIEGDETTGLFDPTGQFTREAAAKIITYMELGPDAAETLTTTNTGFSDVAATRWSAPYIAYAKAQKIIEGYGDGTFGPSNDLTRAAWLKMLLVSLGVDPDKNGLGDDANWDINAQALATKAGLVTAKELKLDWNRETAVLYAFNAMKKAQDPSWTDQFLSADDTNHKTVRQYVPVLDDDTDVDEFGREYTTWTNGLTGKDQVVYAADTNEQVASYENQTVKGSDILKALDLKDTDTAKVEVVINGATATAIVAATEYGGKGSTVEVYKHNTDTEKGETAEYRVVVINTYVAVVGKIAKDAKTIELKTTNPGAGQTETTVITAVASVEGLAKDDVVSFNVGAAKAPSTVTAYNVTVLKGTDVEATGVGTDKEGTYLRIDGEKVYASKYLTFAADAGVSAYGSIQNASVSYDTYGNIIYVAKATPNNKTIDGVVYLAGAESSAQNDTILSGAAAQAKLQVVDLTSGAVSVVDQAIVNEKGTWTYADKDGKAVENKNVGTNNNYTVISGSKNDDVTGTFYGYYLLDDGSYVLEALTSVDVSTGTVVADKGVALIANNPASGYADANTKLTYVTKDAVTGAYTVKTVTGIANFPKLTAKATTKVVEIKDTTTTGTGKTKITEVYVFDATSDNGETVAKTYGAFVRDGEHDLVNDTYEYIFYVDGAEKSYTAKSYTSYNINKVYDISVDEKGELKATAVVAGNSGNGITVALAELGDGYITGSGGAVWYLADGYQIYDTTEQQCGVVAGAKVQPYTVNNAKTGKTEVVYIVVTDAPAED
jgi:hypothetical protein